MDLSGLVQLGGHSIKRTHNNPRGPNVGFAIMKALHDKQAAVPGIKLITSAQVGVGTALFLGVLVRVSAGVFCYLICPG